MSVTLINGDGNPKVLAAQDSDWYATLTEQTTCILKVNGNLEATITDSNTIEIDSGVCISKEGRRVQIDSGDIAEIIIPTGTQGVDTYYIIGFHLYIDDEGTQVAETFCQTMESSTATITETTFKEGSSSIYLSLYRVKREGLSLASVSRIVPLMDLPSNYIAEHEEGATASQNYSVGDYFTNAGSLKKVIATITSGDSISDSNTSDTTVASELSRINSDLSDTQKGKLRIASVRKTINLPSGYTTSVDVAIPTEFSNVVPLFARLSSTSKPLVVFNLYAYNGKFNAHFINAGSETITLTDALFEITYWGVE